MPTRKRYKRRQPLGKRLLATQMTAARLWIPDKQLLSEIAKKRRITEAELAREIIHQWAVKKRLAPDTVEGAEERALIDLQRDTKTAVEGLADLLNRLVEATSGYGDLLSLNEAQITHITSVSNAHYNVSAQTFAALWAQLEMFQRFYLEAQLRDGKLPPVDKELHSKAVEITDNIRAEGLRMVERLIKACQSPQAIRMSLSCPADTQ